MNPRRLWEAVEPIHAAVYFAPEPAEAAKAVGLKGWWMGYFAGRAAPLGPVGAAPVTASFFGFAPRMVARSLPDAWSFASPADVLSSRVAAAGSVLRRVAPSADFAGLARSMRVAVDGCQCDGRPLAAAWWAAFCELSDSLGGADDAALAWLAATVLREHRGDGHVIAATALGLSGLQTSLTLVATGGVTREALQPSRGWTDEEWESCWQGLIEGGLIDGQGLLTGEGAALRGKLESMTDELAAGPLDCLGDEGVAELLSLAAPVVSGLFDSETIPFPNPIGVPRP